MDQLDGSDPRAKKYKEELLGKTSVDSRTVPEEFWYYDAAISSGIEVPDWEDEEKYGIETQAKVIAVHRIRGMSELIDRHYEKVDEKIKKATEKTKSEK